METTQTSNRHSDGVPESAKVSVAWDTGSMSGAPVQESAKSLGELKGLFLDGAAQQRMDPQMEIYRVRWWPAVPAGEPGGLFWGVTILQPGKVGDEYFMTHGHFHADRTRAEYYATASGHGMVVRMDVQRATWGEEMSSGSLHYISGNCAHRVVNTGNKPLIFWACWGSDAGYDYASIREHGFGARVLERDGKAVVVSIA
jgi:glucose-6-phosphate isomerase